ncbi:S41 family peptidase [Phocaeicola plebeius]|uniref:Tricorn protease homolog n=1 Tax=Phocaeicola plebeius TaxID=310297 RepID=A0A921HKC9_9BACT|nr:S41 family peptidase [Phocaeicola plebeius]HJF81178.1 peptidase S41 [Phocaeicola plebeius]
MRKKILCTLLLGTTFAHAMAVTPLWMRDVRISPDGKEILFCYKGDIYKVSAKGGEAVQLTTQESYESSPVWSPDGKQIAFASDRFGNTDVFVMPANGGSARRLTTNSASEIPSAFTPDGKFIVFSASIQDPASSALFPTSAMTELYKVPAEGGKTEQILGTPAEMVCFNAAGDKFLYQDRKGFEDEWRKHHTSSITRDVWMYDMASGKHTNLTKRAGEDRNPVLSSDGKEVFFLSERNKGSFNVYSFPLDNPEQVKALTSFSTHPVRFLSLGGDGTLCYTYNGEIYTQKQGGKPSKVNVSLTRDDQEIPVTLSYTRGASEAVASPDGKQVAFIVRGEVFVTSVEYGTTKQITHTPEAEEGLSFGADNRTLVYASERDGNWQLYKAEIERKEDLNFPNATLIKEEVLLPSKTVERMYPKFSPDGKEVAFIEDRIRLKVLNLETNKVRQITDGSTWYELSGGFNYAWSPDGKWFTLEFIGNKHDPYTDIALVSADGKGELVNLTNSGYTSSSPKWTMDGNAILFTTERYGMRNHASWGSLDDVMMVFVNQDAYDKFRMSKEDYELQKELEKEQEKAADKKDGKKEDKKEDKDKKEEADKVKDIVVELEGIQDRIVRLTPNSSSIASAILSKDGESLYYLSAFERGFDMWKMDLRKRETKLLHKMGSGWADMEMDKEGKNLFVLGSGSMQKMDLGGEKLKPISYRAEMKMDLAAERAYMYDNMCREEQKRFYEVNMHGVDWKVMTANYRRFLPHINNKYDYAEMLSELLGELNVSHTGGRYRPGVKEATASLGLLYDWSYTGKGMKVDEVVEKGPFDRKTTRVKPGVVIEKIDGQPVDADFSALLNGKAGKKILVSFYDAQSKERWDEVVKPISGGTLSSLLYERWVKQRAADVDKWSNGRLGYVHIESMDDGSFRTVYSDILGKYNNREGIVIDTRFNGGGRLHEDIEVLFSGQKYLTQVIRGREACDMPSRRWNKPSIMLQCEANYSNAHGTPWVYKHRQIGKLVGAPVPGTMTSVNWVRMQDPDLIYGIPVIGYRLPDGSYLENKELEPDVYVLNAPETVVKGEDTQLKAAVDELLKELDAKK